MVRCEHRSLDDPEGRNREAPVISARGLTLIIAAVCVVLTGACSASNQTPAASGSPMLAPPEGLGLQPVLTPEFSTVGEAVRQRIREAYAALTGAVGDREATREKLANAGGEGDRLRLAGGERETAERG